MDWCLCPFVFAGRYGCACPRDANVLFLGDSGIDFWKNTEGNCCSATSPQWNALVDDLAGKGQKPAAMGCSGMPAYELCCCAPFVFCCVKPDVIVTMMGSNDLIWLPLPCFHRPCPCAVACYVRMFMTCVPAGKKVIFIPDLAYDIHDPSLGIRNFSRVVRDRLAGTVVTPQLEGSLDSPTWTYSRTPNDRATFEQMVYMDWEPLIDQLGRDQVKERLVRKGCDSGEPTPLFYTACGNMWVAAELAHGKGARVLEAPAQAEMATPST